MHSLPTSLVRVREGQRRRGASVLYVQREFEHVFHLNICTWNSNVANLHKMPCARSRSQSRLKISSRVVTIYNLCTRREWTFFSTRFDSLQIFKYQLFFLNFCLFFFYSPVKFYFSRCLSFDKYIHGRRSLYLNWNRRGCENDVRVVRGDLIKIHKNSRKNSRLNR